MARGDCYSGSREMSRIEASSMIQFCVVRSWYNHDIAKKAYHIDNLMQGCLRVTSVRNDLGLCFEHFRLHCSISAGTEIDINPSFPFDFRSSTREMTTSSTNNSVFRGFFEKQKLTGHNFIDWYRQLRIVLSIEDKLNYLEQPIPPASVAPAEQELLQTTRDFHSCRQKERQSVSSYVLKMKGYIDNLERMGHPVTLGLGTVNELHAMLKLHEQTLPKSNAPPLHAIRAGKVQKGHWKRNCPQYLAELMKKKKNATSGAGGSGIFVIELNTILNRSWIYDTGYGTHICNTTQGLRASRKLKSGALSLYVGNGQREAVEATAASVAKPDMMVDPKDLVPPLGPPPRCFREPVMKRSVSTIFWREEDPFLVALKECSKDYKAKSDKKRFGSLRSKSFLWCRCSFDVEEGNLRKRPVSSSGGQGVQGLIRMHKGSRKCSA
nr:zinc finger, CCHC-type [Tanacetum cinerariifolium]